MCIGNLELFIKCLTNSQTNTTIRQCSENLHLSGNQTYRDRGSLPKNVVDTEVIEQNFVGLESDTATGPSCAGILDLMNHIPFLQDLPLYYAIIGIEEVMNSWYLNA